jgi:hypothetical protein
MLPEEVVDFRASPDSDCERVTTLLFVLDPLLEGGRRILGEKQNPLLARPRLFACLLQIRCNLVFARVPHRKVNLKYGMRMRVIRVHALIGRRKWLKRRELFP